MKAGNASLVTYELNLFFQMGAVNEAAAHRFKLLRGSKTDSRMLEVLIQGVTGEKSSVWQSSALFHHCLEYPGLLLGGLTRFQIYGEWNGMVKIMKANPVFYGEFLQSLHWINPIYALIY
jgi:hypothetical protein